MAIQNHRATMPSSGLPLKTTNTRMTSIISDNNNSSNKGSSSLASLSQIIAMAMTYRRLGFVFLSMPLACMFTPILINIFLWALNVATSRQNLGLPCLVLVYFCTLSWRRQRDKFAPSLEVLQKAQQQDRFILPSMFFLFFCFLLRIVHIPDPDLGLMKVLRWTPSLPWDIGFRPAIGLALINAATLFRFVGPGSLIRCSTVPLASNYFINELRSGVDFLFRLVVHQKNPINITHNSFGIGTGAGAGVLYRPPTMIRTRICGRRYQCPTFISCSANFVVTCLVGYIVAAFILRPYYYYQSSEYSKDSQQKIIDCASLLTMPSFLYPFFNGTGHELNPKHYSKIHPLPLSWNALKGTFKRVILVTVGIVVVVVVLAGTAFFQGVSSIFDVLPLLVESIAISLLLGFYCSAVEEAAKSSLFVGSKLQRFVREITSGHKAGGDSMITIQEEESFVADAALHSLLHGDSDCVQKVGESTASGNPNYQQLETVESTRNKEAIILLAKVMLGQQESKRGPVELALEEDILRISLLESLGGPSPPPKTSHNDESTTTGGGGGGENDGSLEKADPYPMDYRHRQAIEYWVKPSNSSGQAFVVPTLNGGQSKEQKSVLLTRALSAFAGGLGEALIQCSVPNATATTWLLRPGALCAAEYSVIALSRIIVVYFEHCHKTGSDFRVGTQLSSLIAATLNSMYRLHVGVLKHANYLEQQRSRTPGVAFPPLATPVGFAGHSLFVSNISENDIWKDHPDLHSVLHAIEAAAKTILHQMAHHHNTMSTKNALDLHCAEWVKSILRS